MKQFLVTPAAMRPASMEERCFYCRQPIGAFHGPECVLVKKKTTVRMTIEYEVEVPAHWDQRMVEFHRNDGTWCASNAVEELEDLVQQLEENDGCGCLCDQTHFHCLGGDSEPFLNEGGPAKSVTKYRTKPVEVEAFQATRAARADNSDWPQWMHEAWQKDFGTPGAVGCEDYPNSDGTDKFVVTLNDGGTVPVFWDDWIIRFPDGDLRVAADEEFDEYLEPA